MPIAFFPSSCRYCSFSISALIKWPILLNIILRLLADNSPIRSSFVNHDALSMLCTVTVSLLRPIYLPTLHSTVVTRFITNMVDSDFHYSVSDILCAALAYQILLPEGNNGSHKFLYLSLQTR